MDLEYLNKTELEIISKTMRNQEYKFIDALQTEDRQVKKLIFGNKLKIIPYYVLFQRQINEQYGLRVMYGILDGNEDDLDLFMIGDANIDYTHDINNYPNNLSTKLELALQEIEESIKVFELGKSAPHLILDTSYSTPNSTDENAPEYINT